MASLNFFLLGFVMTPELRTSNNNYNAETFLSRFKHLMERDQELLGVVVQRSVVMTLAGLPPQHVVTRIDVLPRASQAAEALEIDYDTLIFSREVLNVAETFERFQLFAENKFQVKELQVSAAGGLGFNDQYQPSQSRGLQWPTRTFDIYFASSVQLPHEPLLHRWLQSYSSPYEAIGQFLEVPGFTSSSDSQLQRITVNVPNLNARIEQLRLIKNQLEVTIDSRAELSSLKLDISYKAPLQSASHSIAVGGRAQIAELAFAPRELQVWLISKDGFLADMHSENEIYSFGSNPVLPKQKATQVLPVLAEEAESVSLSGTASTGEVFVIHGHNTSVKESVARFLERLDLAPLILHERPNRGQTLIEKFEENAEVAFAVALLTADDEGRALAGQAEYRRRARQNVLLELGFFMTKLGRERVCALVEEDVEIPSDYHGIVYIPLDKSGNWKFLLVRELKAAGFEVDANKAV